jgi:integrase/recombinase XerD
MLCELLPKSYKYHCSLPLLGPILDEFDDWLIVHGYRPLTRKSYILSCTAVDKYLHRRNQLHLSELTLEDFHRCRQACRKRSATALSAIKCLRRFLQSRGLSRESTPAKTTKLEAVLNAYRQHLRDVRGLSAVTIEHHLLTSREFLQHCLNQSRAFRFADLTRSHVESFILSISGRFGRGSLQHIVGHVRGILRFLAMRGDAPIGLASQIDRPRVYRLEQLPRALPWHTVQAFLESIDRTCVYALAEAQSVGASLCLCLGRRRLPAGPHGRA